MSGHKDYPYSRYKPAIQIEYDQVMKENDPEFKELVNLAFDDSFTIHTRPVVNVKHIKLDWHISCNEVYPNVYISNESTARNLAFLKKLGITHIVNAAEGKTPGMVDTNANYYRSSNIEYLGIPLEDIDSVPIHQEFHKVADFIQNGINKRGKVLIHCVMGISRSSTCVIAYLMIKKGLTVMEALMQVKKHRCIRPNLGFLRQLLELDRQKNKRK